MKRFRRCMVLLAVCCCLILSGCTVIGIEVENQMRPPINAGDQEALHAALEKYLSDNGTVHDYTLKYPIDGSYLSAFVLLSNAKEATYISKNDTSGISYNTEQLADYCMVFYRLNVENSKTHVHLLKKTDGIWETVADKEGYGEEVAQVEFADLDGDRFPELLVGWNAYNSKDKRLTVYSLADSLTPITLQNYYRALKVADLTGDNTEDIVLFSTSDTNGSSVATVYTFQDELFAAVGSAKIDHGIQRFGTSYNVEFVSGERGIFIDAHKDPETTVTELIVWRNGKLISQFCDPNTLMNTVTAREGTLSCKDIDGDGVIEWPQISVIEQDDPSETTTLLNKTQWYYYDSSTDAICLDFDSIICEADNYTLRITEDCPTVYSALYDNKTRVLTLYTETAQGTAPFLKIQTTTSGKKADLIEGMTYFDSTDLLHYAVWYDETMPFTMEKIHYLFTLTEEQP